MAEQEQKVKKSGDKKGLMIALIALVVILLIGVIGLVGYIFSKDGFSDSSTKENSTKERTLQAQNADTFKVSINDLVLNIITSKGREKLMKLSFTLKSTEPTIETIVENHKPEIIDIVISQVSSRNSEELLTVGGKSLLREQLIDEINLLINKLTSTNENIKKDSIKNLYFTSFVIK